MGKCSYKKCKNHSSKLLKKDGISYFHFPRDPVCREKWRSVVAQQRCEPYFKPYYGSIICSKHFKECDGYNTKTGMRRLRKTAVAQPRIYLSSTFLYNCPLALVGNRFRMTTYLQPNVMPRQKIPKDGPGPRGVPDCYYTSRVLNSTYRYVKFVRKLRAEEDERRKGDENKLKTANDQMISDFFLKCDRSSLINDVARRVDLCMASYEEDLQAKRQRLIELYKREEEEDLGKFVVMALAGAEAVFQDKKERLQFLLAKRKKEHEEKYKDTPLSKCVHVLPCIYKLRAKEAQEIQLYQIKEKKAKKMAEKEFDKMWYEVAMKESEALKARMEQDEIERARRDHECKLYTDAQLEQRRQQREREKQMLKEETLRFKRIWEADNLKEEEAERKRKEHLMETVRDRDITLQEKREFTVKLDAEAKTIADTWDKLGTGLDEQKAVVALARKKERELDACNRHLRGMRDDFIKLETKDDDMFNALVKQQLHESDSKRCAYTTWSKRTNQDCREATKQQAKERSDALVARRAFDADADECERQMRAQLSQLIANKQLTDAQARKMHQSHILQQIDYKKLLKERALQEERDQMKKCQLAADEYQKEIERMMKRPFFSDEQHPFMKQMAKGLKMVEKCPCTKPDYCK